MSTITFSPFPYLETARLSLWQMERGDAHDILALRSDDRVNLYIDRKKMISIEEAEYFIDRINRGIDRGEWIFWSVALKHTNKFLGTVCLWNIVAHQHKAELGYELMHEVQGHGYMQEAVEKVLYYGFQIMKLQTIEAVIKDGNERSIKLADRNGFVFKEKIEDNLVYTLSNVSLIDDSF